MTRVAFHPYLRLQISPLPGLENVCLRKGGKEILPLLCINYWHLWNHDSCPGQIIVSNGEKQASFAVGTTFKRSKYF